MEMIYTVLGIPSPATIEITQDMDISGLNLTLNGNKYAIAVDPSTSSSGIIVGNVETKYPEYMIALKRDRKSGKENDHTVYNQLTYNVFDKWVNDNKNKIIAIKIEQPYKDPKQTYENYAKQMASFHVYTSIAKKHGINCITVTAPKWRSYFLADYKTQLGLDLRKSNKKEVHMVASSMQIELQLLPDDCTDAYGIWKHYLAVDYNDSGILMAPGDNYRENTHKVFWVVSSQENVIGYLETYLKSIQKYTPTAIRQEFIYNPKLSLENNIRAFTSSTTDQKYNLYYCQIYPTIGIIREITKFRPYIGRIHANTPLYVIGYRPK